MLSVRLLGELALELDGEDLPPPTGRPARALLAWLALNPGAHARSRLAAGLWPEVLDESARASLRNALAALRRALPEDGSHALVATRERIGLGSEVWVDVRAFDELAASGRLQEALALGRGVLLPDLDEDWVLDARDRHKERRASVLGRAADDAEREGDREQAIEHSREWVTLDPFSEEAQRALIRRLAAAGDRAAALAAYNRFRERVGRELGLVPSRETRALVEDLRVRGAARLADLPLPQPLARHALTGMVGRRAELERLRAAWDRAATGERRLVLVAGEAGVGKSRLVSEWARRVHEDGAAVLYGRANQDALIAYQPFVEALRPWLATEGAEGGELARMVPGSMVERSGDAAPEGERFRLFEAVSSLLASVSRERPVLLVLEDLHWADRSTLMLLAHLARGQDPARLLVAATHREDEPAAQQWLTALAAEVRRERAGERLELTGLEATEVEALIGDRLGTAAPDDLSRALHRRTGGNPLFVEELLRHVAEAGALDRGARGVDEVGVPEGVKDVIGRRVASLGDDAVEVLRVASVLGRAFEVSPVEGIVDGITGDQVVDALERAVDAGLVHEDPGVVGRYAFAHGLVRETLYAALGATRRMRLHARVADVLERLHGDAPERLGELAHHLLEAASPHTAERGAEYAARAGWVALAQLAHAEAAGHFSRALHAIALLDEPRSLLRCDLLLALGDAQMRAGESVEGRKAFAQAAAAARGLGRADLLARAALGFGGVGVRIIEVDQQTVELLEEALRGVGEGQADLRARLLARLAVELYYGPARDRSDELSREAIEVAARSGEERTLGYALNARHVALWRPDRLGERLDIASEMVVMAERAHDQEAALQGRNWLVTDVFEAGEIDRLRAAIDDYERAADQLGLPAYAWYVPLWRAAIATLEGSLAEARELVGEVRRIGRHAGDPNAGLLADMVEHTELIVRGRPDLTIERHEELLTEKASGSPAALAYAAGWSWCYAGTGDMAAAREHFERVADDDFGHVPFDVNRLDTLAACAETCRALRDANRAAVLDELLLPFADRHACGAGRALGSWGSVQRPLGLLSATMGRSVEAEERFEAALDANRALGWRPWLAWTQYQYAAVLLAGDLRGDRQKAAQLLGEAAGHARELGLDGLQTRVGALERSVTHEHGTG